MEEGEEFECQTIKLIYLIDDVPEVGIPSNKKLKSVWNKFRNNFLFKNITLASLMLFFDTLKGIPEAMFKKLKFIDY